MNSEQFTKLLLKKTDPMRLDVVVKNRALYLGDSKITPELEPIELVLEYQRYVGWLDVLQYMLKEDEKKLRKLVKKGW